MAHIQKYTSAIKNYFYINGFIVNIDPYSLLSSSLAKNDLDIIPKFWYHAYRDKQ